MAFNEYNGQNEQDGRAANEQEQNRATGYKADDDNGIEEKDLKRNPLFGQGEMHAVSEGQPMGGQSFGEDGNPTPTGDDKDNPSRNAGYTNGYFARTKPSEEYTADNNFKAPEQQGEPEYDNAQANVAGPQELPEQQQVGEDEENHIET